MARSILALCLILVGGSFAADRSVVVRSESPDPDRIPTLEVYEQDEWGQHFTYLGIEFPDVPGLVCDLWCFESGGIEFDSAIDLGNGSVRMRHDWVDHNFWIDTIATPEEGEVAIRATLIPKDPAAVEEVSSPPGLNICWQLRRAENFKSKPEEYSDFVKRCFMYDGTGRKFLHQTQRLPIPVRPDTDKENNPPWVQMYSSLAGDVLDAGTKSWAAYSPDRYRYPLIGAVSKDEKSLVAMGNGSLNAISQAWHDCMHNNASWTKNEEGEWEWIVRLYAMENDEAALLSRFLEDFPQADALNQAQSDPISIGEETQLFLDDYLIEKMDGLDRKVNPIEKHPENPVLMPDKPWEGPYTIVYGSVLREEDRYRMWYYGQPGVCYAESEDGIQWTKPELDLVEYEGRKTNIVIDRNSPQSKANPFEYFYELFGVFKDPLELNPQRRYKMGVLCIHRDYKGPREDPFHHGQRRGLGIATSPDGIYWNEGFDFATEAICDGATHLMWDPYRKKCVVYGRTKHIDENLLQNWDNEWANKYYWGRAVARAENDDLLNWPPSLPGEAPMVMTVDSQDPPGTEIYGMNVFPYQGIYIALIQMFYNQPDDCCLDVQLGVSRDGIHFERLSDRSPFIPVGGIGEWDRFNQSPANNPPIVVEDELRFYYGGRSYRHSPYDGPDKGERFGGVGFGSIPKDRFASLEASYQGGTLLTKPLLLNSDRITLNAESKFGEILLTVIDQEGEVLAESEPVTSSGLAIPIEWKEGMKSIQDAPVQIRFTIRNAKLYTFKVGEESMAGRG